MALSAFVSPCPKAPNPGSTGGPSGGSPEGPLPPAGLLPPEPRSFGLRQLDRLGYSSSSSSSPSPPPPPMSLDLPRRLDCSLLDCPPPLLPYWWCGDDCLLGGGSDRSLNRSFREGYDLLRRNSMSSSSSRELISSLTPRDRRTEDSAGFSGSRELLSDVGVLLPAGSAVLRL